jgi:hypothetical protein
MMGSGSKKAASLKSRPRPANALGQIVHFAMGNLDEDSNITVERWSNARPVCSSGRITVIDEYDKKQDDFQWRESGNDERRRTYLRLEEGHLVCIRPRARAGAGILVFVFRVSHFFILVVLVPVTTEGYFCCVHRWFFYATACATGAFPPYGLDR